MRILYAGFALLSVFLTSNIAFAGYSLFIGGDASINRDLQKEYLVLATDFASHFLDEQLTFKGGAGLLVHEPLKFQTQIRTAAEYGKNIGVSVSPRLNINFISSEDKLSPVCQLNFFWFPLNGSSQISMGFDMLNKNTFNFSLMTRLRFPE